MRGAEAARTAARLCIACAVVACSGHSEVIPPEAALPLDCPRGVRLEFVPEVPTEQAEAYVCFGYDAQAALESPIRSLVWSDPVGGTVLHHATLYATSEARPTDAPFACDPMPADATSLHVWALGASQLELPEDLGLALPSGTRTLIVEAHAFRVSAEAAGTSSVQVCLHEREPPRLAGRVRLLAPVPAIRPHQIETSSSRCRFDTAFHMILSGPHMHKIGREFHSARLRAGARSPIVDVVDWDFNDQRTYRIDVDIEPGDVVETTCVWENSTTDYVLPGIFTGNEMCTQGIFGWPAGAASCEYE